MKAVVFDHIGGPEVLEMRDVPEPTPGPGEVAIRVAYAGVNFAEVMLRRGDKIIGSPPVTPGIEVSGYVKALGAGVEGLQVGEPVAAFTVTGGYAEVVVTKAPLVSPLGEAISLEQGGAFPTIVPTADALLQEVTRLQAGEAVLVQAAAGGVGTIAGQIARRLGAGKVLGTVSSLEKADYARRFGYDDVFLYKETADRVRQATGGDGVDVLLASVDGTGLLEDLKLLAPLGRLATFGNASANPFPPLSVGDLWFGNRSVMGFSMGHLASTAPERLAMISRRSLKYLEEKSVVIDITQVLPLEQAAEAHRLLENRGTKGKLLLQISKE